MTPGARLQAAIELLAGIEGSGRPADAVVAAYFKGRRYVGAKDRRAIAERVYTILRRRARLDWWTQRASAFTPDARRRVLADLALCESMLPEDLAPLLKESHAPPPLNPDERRLMAALKGRPLETPEMPDWVLGEYPEWLHPHLAERFGGELQAEMAALRSEAPLDLRTNALTSSREEARQALLAQGLEAEVTPLSPLGLRLSGRYALGNYRAFADGLVEVQDEGSQLVALLVGARPGEAVCDFCAGAGGKTLALAAAMANKGRLVACDIHDARIDRAGERLRRAGVHNVTRRVLSAEGERWLKRAAGSFDRVLVDAPCTGTGTWRRNPDARWSLSPKDLDELVVVQADILRRAARLVRPGGRLVYATCSLLPPENERQVEAFTAVEPEFRTVPVADVWAEAVEGECPADGPFLRLTPARHGTDGFFAAVLARAG